MGNCQTAIHEPAFHDRYTFVKPESKSGRRRRRKYRSRNDYFKRFEDDASMVTASATSASVASPMESGLPEDDASMVTTPAVSTFIKSRVESGIPKTHGRKDFNEIDFDCSTLTDALKESARFKKPIICFDINVAYELSEFFSHPLLAEAIETLFVSLRQMNNGKNKIQVRILDESGVDVVVGIKGKQVSLASMTSFLVDGLKALEKDIPKYLLLIEEEENGKIKHLSDGTLQRIDRQITLGMKDSKIGEVEFADLEGVLATKAGYISHQKVVRVTYDSAKLSFCNLVRFALQRHLSDIIYYQSNEERLVARIEIERVMGNNKLIRYLGTLQVDTNPKYSLSQTLLKHVPLTDLQALKANNLASRGVFNEATHLLSPKQGSMLMKTLRKSSNACLTSLIDVPICRAWGS